MAGRGLILPRWDGADVDGMNGLTGPCCCPSNPRNHAVRSPAPLSPPPPPRQDLNLFDAFQTEPRASPRRPRVRNLYDVFVQIATDEGEHVNTMAACQVRRQACRFRCAAVWLLSCQSPKPSSAPPPLGTPPPGLQDFSVAADLAAIKERQRDEALNAVLGAPATGAADGAPSKPSAR
jgi:hypothetical protein